MGVKVIEVGEGYRSLKLKLPLKWHGKNMHGTMFGGFMCAVADPLPALLVARIFEGTDFWTKSNAVEFLRPAKSDLICEVKLSEETIDAIRKELDSSGRITYEFNFDFIDKRGSIVAKVKNCVFLRKRRTSSK